MKRFVVAAASVLILAVTAGAASAQYYDPYRPRPPRYDPYDGPRYDRPPPRDWRYHRPRPRPMGQVCVTSRGACNSYPAPVGAPCQCNVPGFGRKRGNIQ